MILEGFRILENLSHGFDLVPVSFGLGAILHGRADGLQNKADFLDSVGIASDATLFEVLIGSQGFVVDWLRISNTSSNVIKSLCVKSSLGDSADNLDKFCLVNIWLSLSLGEEESENNRLSSHRVV